MEQSSPWTQTPPQGKLIIDQDWDKRSENISVLQQVVEQNPRVTCGKKVTTTVLLVNAQKKFLRQTTNTAVPLTVNRWRTHMLTVLNLWKCAATHTHTHRVLTLADLHQGSAPAPRIFHEVNKCVALAAANQSAGSAAVAALTPQVTLTCVLENKVGYLTQITETKWDSGIKPLTHSNPAPTTVMWFSLKPYHPLLGFVSHRDKDQQ